MYSKCLFVISIVLILLLTNCLPAAVLCLFNHVSFYMFGFNCDTSWIRQYFLRRIFVYPILASTHSSCGCSSGGRTSPSKQHRQEISVPTSIVIHLRCLIEVSSRALFTYLLKKTKLISYFRICLQHLLSMNISFCSRD